MDDDVGENAFVIACRGFCSVPGPLQSVQRAEFWGVILALQANDGVHLQKGAEKLSQVAYSCASHNVVFFSNHRVVNVVIAPNAMIGCSRSRRFVVVLMYGRLEWVGCDGGGRACSREGKERGEGEE